MNVQVKHYKVLQLPKKTEPSVVYYVLDTDSLPGQFRVKVYITDNIGIPIPILDLNSGGGGGSVNSVTGTGVTGSLTNPVVNIATFVSQQLNNKVFISTEDGKLFVKPITSPDGSISINETSNEIRLQVSEELQDSILDILNDITNIEIDISNIKLDIIDLQDNKFDNPTGDDTEYLDGAGNPTPFPSIPSGSTNLNYTPSPTDGTITSDTGSDATIPLADNTNAGLLSPSEKTEIVHSNRSILDAITESFTTVLKTAYDTASNWVSTNGATVLAHLSNMANPHNVTAAQVGALPTGTTTSGIAEGTNLYFTTARVLATLLTGLSLVTGGAIVSTDSVLIAFGKIQKQINDISSAFTTGAASSTDNAITRFDGVTGKVIQNSNAILNDDGSIILTSASGTSYVAGKLFYDATNYCYTYYNAITGVSQQLGYEGWVLVYNSTGSTIANGKAVYINGNDGGTTLPTITLAQSNAGTSLIAAGLTTHSIPTGTIGIVTNNGVVHDLDTNAWTAGTIVYISATVSGDLVSTAPLYPNYRMRVGVVTRQHATLGSILVTPSTGSIGNGTALQVLRMNAAGTNQEFATIIQDSITDGVIEVAPSQNAVYDGLDTKNNKFIKYDQYIIAPTLGTTTLNIIIGNTFVNSGSNVARTFADTNILTRTQRIGYETTAVAGNSNTSRQTLGYFTRANGYDYVTKIGASTGAGTLGNRAFFGISTQNNLAANIEYNTLTLICGIGILSTSTNWQIMHNDASGTATTVDTGFPCNTVSDELIEVRIRTIQATSAVEWTVTRLSTGAVFNYTATTDIPTPTQLAAVFNAVNNNANAAIFAVDWCGHNLKIGINV